VSVVVRAVTVCSVCGSDWIYRAGRCQSDYRWFREHGEDRVMTPTVKLRLRESRNKGTATHRRNQLERLVLGRMFRDVSRAEGL
jgi:hypothetical protein